MPMLTPDIITGDDVSIPIELTKGGATFVIDPGATVQAAVTARKHKNDAGDVYITAQPVTEVVGSDWPNSLLVVEFTSAQTAAINRNGDATLEIQVDDGGKLTWLVPITIRQGTIT